MKKVILILVIILVSAFNLCNAQTNQDDDAVYIEVEGNVETIYDSIEIKQVTRFASGLPDIDITRSRMSTDEEFIFKTYIMEKLLKSNRVLY